MCRTTNSCRTHISTCALENNRFRYKEGRIYILPQDSKNMYLKVESLEMLVKCYELEMSQ
jgi:hypothetical protein